MGRIAVAYARSLAIAVSALLRGTVPLSRTTPRSVTAIQPDHKQLVFFAAYAHTSHSFTKYGQGGTPSKPL